jgi:ABC-type transport system involved in cytochrome c biogenesis permease component
MLIASWLISSIGVLYAYGPELSYSAAGRGFFTAFYTVLSIAVFIVVPQGAFRSIQSERGGGSFEMLTITTLSPRKIVWGKWWSATVQTMVYYAAIAPFMVFTNLLRGISLPLIAFVLFWSFVGSVTLAMLAITFSTFTKERQAFGLLQFLLVMPLVGMLIAMMQWMHQITGQELPFDQLIFWFVQLIIFSLLIPAFILFRQIATANLTFEGANRSTGIRISCAILLAISLGWLLLFADHSLLPASLTPSSSLRVNEVVGIATPLAIWLWLVGLFTATEDDRLSRRVRQEVPRRFLVRLLVLPLYPGGGRGFLYFLMSVLLFTAVASYLTVVATGTLDERTKSQIVILAIASYLLFYIGLTSFLGRGLRKIGTDLITNPFYACYKLIYEADTAPPLAGILLMGAAGVILNAKNVFLSIREFLTAGSNAAVPTETHSA